MAPPGKQKLEGRWIQGVSLGKPEIPRRSDFSQSKTFYLTSKQSHKVLLNLLHLFSRLSLPFLAWIKLLKNPLGNQNTPRKILFTEKTNSTLLFLSLLTGGETEAAFLEWSCPPKVLFCRDRNTDSLQGFGLIEVFWLFWGWRKG